MRASFTALIEQIRNAISGKTVANTITPFNVGEDGFVATITLLDSLIKDQNLSSGELPPSPSMGVSGDYYIQSGNPVITWQKIGANWTNTGTFGIRITFPDGNYSVKTSLSSGIVTATAGVWYYDNQQFSKSTQTQFNISAANATQEINDIVYANTLNQILYLNGSPGAGPPALPPDTVIIDTVIIPSIDTGLYPYLVYGNSSTGGVNKNIFQGDQSDTSGTDPNYLEVDFLTDETIWTASFIMNGITYFIGPEQLQNGNQLYGFPTNDNNFTIKITYI